MRVVRDLTEAWQAAITRREMRLVVVEGPTGVGKTAVVQALYEQFAMLQTRPEYWPTTLVPTITGGDAAVLRQDRASRIYPMQVTPAEGARLEWFWWGLTAQIGEFAALGGDPQIRYHVVPIADAIGRGDRLTRDRLVLAAKAVSLLASLGGLGSLLANMAVNADTARDAVELLLSAPDVLRSRADLLAEARSSRGGTVFWGTAEQEARAGAEKDGRVLGRAARVMPMVIAVEAAQFLDPSAVM